jgi:hypothetical protein
VSFKLEAIGRIHDAVEGRGPDWNQVAKVADGTLQASSGVAATASAGKVCASSNGVQRHRVASARIPKGATNGRGRSKRCAMSMAAFLCGKFGWGPKKRRVTGSGEGIVGSTTLPSVLPTILSASSWPAEDCLAWRSVVSQPNTQGSDGRVGIVTASAENFLLSRRSLADRRKSHNWR